MCYANNFASSAVDRFESFASNTSLLDACVSNFSNFVLFSI